MLPTPAKCPRPRKTSHRKWPKIQLDLEHSLTICPHVTQIRDAEEGADIIMVKPSLPYLDIISEARTLAPNHPLACYQVSGEFAMIHAGANAGVYDLKAMAFETMDAFLRSGQSGLF